MEGTSIRTQISGATWRGFQYTFTTFTTGATSLTAFIRIGISGGSDGATRNIYFDDVRIQKYHAVGVGVGPQSWDTKTPPDITQYGGASGAIIKNGIITQGSGAGNLTHAIFLLGNLINVEINNVNITVYGNSAYGIGVSGGGKNGLKIHDNIINSNVTTVYSRDAFDGTVIYIGGSSGGLIYNNTINGGPQSGIYAPSADSSSPNQIYNNTISLTGRYTNDFAIQLYGDRGGSLVHNNVINCGSGNNSCRGIFAGGNANSTKIYNNTISVQELKRNQEYNGCQAAGSYGIQIEVASNVEVYNNIVTANANECSSHAFRTNPGNDSNIYVHNNTFNAFSTSPNVFASSVKTSGVTSTVILLFKNNILTTNSLWLFNNEGQTSNLDLTSNTFTTSGTLQSPFYPLVTYDWNAIDYINGIRFVDNLYGTPTTESLFEGTSIVCGTDKGYLGPGSGLCQAPSSYIDTRSSFYYAWLLTVNVKDTSNNPVASASVTILDKNNTQVFSGFTDSLGNTIATLDQFKNTSGIKTFFNPYTITVSKSGSSTSSSVTMDSTKSVTLQLVDTAVPVISAVSASSVTTTGATVTWTTNKSSDTQVEYGTTTSYGLSTTLNTSMVQSHSQVLSRLAASTLYHYRVRSKDTSGNLAVSQDFTFTTSTSGDILFIISRVTASSITATSATITWTTTKSDRAFLTFESRGQNSDTQVEYGTTTSYGLSTALNTLMVTNHSQELNGLTPNTLYHYRVKSRDSEGNLAVSGNFSFTTSDSSALAPAPSVGLNDNEQLLASISDVIAGIAEIIKEMLKR